MPAVSKAQARFMRAVQSGSINKKGLSRAKASEFVEGVKTKTLPERRPSAKETRTAQGMTKSANKGDWYG